MLWVFFQLLFRGLNSTVKVVQHFGVFGRRNKVGGSEKEGRGGGGGGKGSAGGRRVVVVVVVVVVVFSNVDVCEGLGSRIYIVGRQDGLDGF